MPMNIVLSIEGLQGTSQQKAAAGAIKLSSFSFGAWNPSAGFDDDSMISGGQAEVREFQCTKATDISSPTFFMNLCAGTGYTSAKVELLTGGGKEGGQPWLTFEFPQGIFVSDVHWQGLRRGEGNAPEETITFKFPVVKILYKGFAEGMPQGDAAGQFHVVQNTIDF